MAANKFATMLHRNSPRITVVLVYAFLEWILIALLLLHSCFTFLISKFASYFCLPAPCLWCSSSSSSSSSSISHTNLICESHSKEISTLTLCTSHRRLADSHSMCLDCLASAPPPPRIAAAFSFISWVATRDNGGDDDEKTMKSKSDHCSCCGGIITPDLYPPPPYLLLKPLKCGIKDDDDGDVKGSHLMLMGIEANGENGDCFSLKGGAAVEVLRNPEEEEVEAERQGSCLEIEFAQQNQSSSDDHDRFIDYCFGEDDPLDIISLHGDSSGSGLDRLVPVELIDSSTSSACKSPGLKQGDEALEEDDAQEQEEEEVATSLEINTSTGERSLAVNLADTVTNGLDEDANTRGVELHNSEAEEASLLNCGDHQQQQEIKDVGEQAQDCAAAQEGIAQDTTLILNAEFEELHNPSANGVQEESTPLPSQTEEEEDREESEPLTDPQQTHVTSNGLDELLHSLDPINTSVENGIGNPDQEKFPDTPNSMDHNLHNELLTMFEKRDFDDGSMVSETESGDPVLTVERLRTALKSERNALNALYAELEEERSASAIAANQTMAMINRLQEEKAAMQMEALQYQRMMEEQSEYDQEALQLLNDLMIKREKEKQELERELEVYRKRVFDYEAREKLRMVRRRSGNNSSATCSNGEDSDELSSIDLNREARDESGSMSENPESSNDHNSAGGGEDENINLEEIAMDCVHHMTALDDSLAEFEDERLSILDQLKVLEEKLLNLEDSDELMKDVNSVRQSLNYSSVSQHGFDDSYDDELSTPEEENGDKEIKHCPEGKTMGSMAKSLLPLLDAAEDDDDREEEEGLTIEKKNVEISGMDDDSSSVVCRFGGESKKLAIEEEVDHVYERLQALEADREFLKHCMSSIQKGDKGMDLLQEILQHLRDLRAVELRVRSMSESPLS